MNEHTSNWFVRVLRGVPTLLVLCALAGLAYWGHRTGWKAPPFAAVWTAKEAEGEEDWCEEHNVAESSCVACRPQLVGADPGDWCRSHGVPESKCTICQPSLLKSGGSEGWCAEHGIVEANCTICRPEIAVYFRPRAAGATAKRERPPSLPSPGVPGAGSKARACLTHYRRVQFASVEATAKAGIEFAQVEEQPMTEILAANGELEYDRTRLASVGSRAGGVVWRIDARAGQLVRKGDVLALIDAGEVGRAKAELLSAAATREVKARALARVQASASSGLRTEVELQEAQAGLKEAEIRVFNARQALVNLGFAMEEGKVPDERTIRLLGLPESVVKGLESASANLLPIVAPFDGTILEVTAVTGEVVEAGKALLTLADTRRLWLHIELPAAAARRVALKQEVVFESDALAAPAKGTIAWISTSLDDQTRTRRARAQIENPDGTLVAKTFGTARITVRQDPRAVVVPDEAIQWDGCCSIVFVRVRPELFQCRKVRTGTKAGGVTEILVGLMPGETVVGTGSYVLRSEILKGNLGPGCCEGH